MNCENSIRAIDLQKMISLSYTVLDLVEGKQVVELDRAQVEEETQKWKCGPIIYVVGDTPGDH